MFCMSLLIGEVEYIEGQGWEDGGQGSLCCGERMSYRKQHQPEPLLHLQLEPVCGRQASRENGTGDASSYTTLITIL